MKPIDPQLQQFIDATKCKGAADEGLAAILSREGWPAPQIYSALGDYWARQAGLEIPARTGRGEASRDAFLYLLAFSTLATWSSALGALLFQLIGHWLPDQLAPGGAPMLRSQLTWGMAYLAVTFPVYLLVMRRIVRETHAEPERLQSGVRKWLTWIALLLTAGGMIGDLICFLGYFLTCEITLRFVLKCLVVFAISGGVFAYYIGFLRAPKKEDNPETALRDLLFAAAASMAAIGVFCAALAVAGTPVTQRHLEADARRAQDLRQIANTLWAYRVQTHSIPPTLTDPVIHRRLGANTARDPETSVPYEYRPLEDTKYELCAAFMSASTDTASFWNHPAGRSCYQLDAAQAVPF